jgi:hypothetical protein
MSSILYYSNYCEHSKCLIQTISRSSVKNDIHFICIDKRIKKSNGSVYIQFENGQEILLPPTVTKVPALLLLNRGHQILFGDEILNHLQPREEINQNVATDFNGEPNAFSFDMGGNGLACGVTSDCYSFLDQDADSLSCKGSGGMRQQRHYAALDQQDQIETPPDTYSADTINESALKEYEKQRNTMPGQNFQENKF